MGASELLALTLLGASCAAEGQVGQATWLWDVTTQDGDAIVQPGETATVTLSIDMMPDVGEQMVLGFGGANFDVLGGFNADKGAMLDWVINPDLSTVTKGTLDGVNIIGIGAGQITIDGFVDDDPIFIMSFEWSPNEPADFDVEYTTMTFGPDPVPGTVGIWVGENLANGDIVTWPIDEATIEFAVVPSAPTILPLLAVGALACRARRA